MKKSENLIHFHKMNALGNDFFIFFKDENRDIDFEEFLLQQRIEKLGNRFRGIGFDQLIFVEKSLDSKNFDFEMKIFNQDGSESEICGNATRCCIYLIYKIYGLKNEKIKSGSQILSCSFDDENILANVFFQNAPQESLPNDFNQKKFFQNSNFHGEIIDSALVFTFKNLQPLKAFYVNIGNPHIVFFLEEKLNWEKMNQIGKIITEARIFENGINIGFCFPLSENSCILKVFERGVGLTFACGSGACAAAFLGFQNKVFKSNEINVYFLEKEGDLELKKENSIQIRIDEFKKIHMKGNFQYGFFGFVEKDF